MYFYDWAEAMEELAYIPRRIRDRIHGRLGNALGNRSLHTQGCANTHSHPILDTLIHNLSDVDNI